MIFDACFGLDDDYILTTIVVAADFEIVGIDYED